MDWNLRQEQYDQIDHYCKEKGIAWYVSPWDEKAVDFAEQYNPPCHKIASASLTDDDLLQYIRSKGRPIILSTGMSTLEQVDHAVDTWKRRLNFFTCLQYISCLL